MTGLQYPLDIEAAAEPFRKRNNIYCLILSKWSLGTQSNLTPEFEQVLSSLSTTPDLSAPQSDEAPGHAAKKKKKILQHRQGCVSPEEELKVSWSFIFIVHNGKRYQLTATSNQPVSSWRPKKLSSNSTQVFHPPKYVSICRKKNADNEASDVDAKGGPAVVFATAAPILGCCHCCRPVSNVPIRVFPSGGGARLWVILIILVKVAILHHAEAGSGTEVLAAALVLLDGLVERPQLAQQRHVLLTKPHLEEVVSRLIRGTIHSAVLKAFSLVILACTGFSDSTIQTAEIHSTLMHDQQLSKKTERNIKSAFPQCFKCISDTRAFLEQSVID